MNSRLAERKKTSTSLLFLNADFTEKFRAEMLDLSTTGAFVATENILEPDTKVLVQFSLNPVDPKETQTFTLLAEIKRQSDKKRGPGRFKRVIKGMGIKFLSLTPEEFLHLKKYLETTQQEIAGF
jgi:hypothetical protein